MVAICQSTFSKFLGIAYFAGVPMLHVFIRVSSESLAGCASQKRSSNQCVAHLLTEALLSQFLGVTQT